MRLGYGGGSSGRGGLLSPSPQLCWRARSRPSGCGFCRPAGESRTAGGETRGREPSAPTWRALLAPGAPSPSPRPPIAEQTPPRAVSVTLLCWEAGAGHGRGGGRGGRRTAGTRAPPLLLPPLLLQCRRGCGTGPAAEHPPAAGPLCATRWGRCPKLGRPGPSGASAPPRPRSSGSTDSSRPAVGGQGLPVASAAGPVCPLLAPHHRHCGSEGET